MSRASAIHERTNEPTHNPFTAALHSHAAGASPEASPGSRRTEESCAIPPGRILSRAAQSTVGDDNDKGKPPPSPFPSARR
ncbi:hypothetical protein HETIRDRAFT_454382 [Heterobasidion irregulare TC 32-1]|uniref:Uncharacterized protein n=1 Tax=Heterobasidion irregulare (strain TC 32-1) TaxID=747525 RepID=W4JYB6_HETIT|nr:uncharacterized protein HETIRDRAFT_454382 [Heterobasidion irregulare TC 32-1]ETW78444.1 hypothetical protein HETIRDRAFT_454382 [Heterobasidion irregulare TC 32-1]